MKSATVLMGERIVFLHYESGVIVHKTNLEHHIVVPRSLKKRFLHLNHYPAMKGHPGGRKLYHRIRSYL